MKTTLTSDRLIDFLFLLRKKGVTPEVFEKCLESRILNDVFNPEAKLTSRDAWRVALGLGRYTFIVDYSMSLSKMLLDVGGYWNHVDRDINSINFPIVGEGIIEYEFRIFRPRVKTSMELEKVIKLIKSEDKRNPWGPAKIEHLIAFGGKFPEKQLKGNIVAPSPVNIHGKSVMVLLADEQDVDGMIDERSIEVCGCDAR
jgi:hypothetical protein